MPSGPGRAGPGRPGRAGPGRPGRGRGPGRPGPGDAVRRTRALVGAVLVVLVVAVLAAALLGDGGDSGRAGPGAGPATRPGAEPGPPPPELAPLLPAVHASASEAVTADPDRAPTASGLAAALGPLAADPALGPRVSVAVVDAATGEALWSSGPAGVLPASTAKLVTGAAALTALDPGTRLTTRVLAGPAPGEVVLVGGGDPTLAGPGADPALRYGGTRPARLAALADATAAALGADPDATAAALGADPDAPAAALRADPGAPAPAGGVGAAPRLLVDDTLFAGPDLAPGWRPTYLTEGSVARVSALAVDAGRVDPARRARHPDPALAAGERFAALLAERGVDVGPVERGTAAPGARQLAAAQSPPVAALVEHTLLASDNDLAEALARHVALARGVPATPRGAAEAVRAVAVELGLDPSGVAVADGSGLSRESRVAPGELARLLALAARPDRPGLRPLLTGLPVAGSGGTLALRYRDAAGAAAPGAGEVRAKTGTLSDVSGLAGVVTDETGRLLAFAAVADAVPGGREAAEAALDRLAAGLAACGCR